MLFSGFPFLLFFLPLALGGYALVSRFGDGWAKAWLIAASLLFYTWDTTRFLPILLLSVAGNLTLLRRMHRAGHPGRWALAGILANLAALGWFKYSGFATGVPLGMSYFTFTQIGALVLHADGETTPPAWADYALFAAFFPGLLAGPILNAREQLPAFARRGWRLRTDDLAVGSGFFVLGLLKKTLLADPLAATVAQGFAHPAAQTLFPAWQAACGYSLQLYFDFSGYTDMAIGLAWMFGLRFPDNFDRPYRATSVIDYWQRWHMSLTRFLMSNVHGPLTLAVMRHRRARGLGVGAAAQASPGGFLMMMAVPIMATMLLVGLWHGATWPFVTFGVLHAGFLLVNHGWRLARRPTLPPLASTAITYLCVLVGLVVFRATRVGAALALLRGMAGLHGIGPVSANPRVLADFLWFSILYGIVWFAPTTRQIMQGEAESALRWRPTHVSAVIMGAAATLGLLAAGGSTEFLYFRF